MTGDRAIAEGKLLACLGIEGDEVEPGPPDPVGEQALIRVAGLEDPQRSALDRLGGFAAPRVCDTPRTHIAEYRGADIGPARLGLARLHKRGVNALINTLAERWH